MITAYSTDGSNQSSNIELEVNKCRQYFIKDGDIKESPIYGTPFAVYEGYYRDHLYTASFPEGLICKYGDGNVLYQRVNTIDTTIANRSSYSYETTITNSDQPIITICASQRGFSGVYISKYYFEY